MRQKATEFLQNTTLALFGLSDRKGSVSLQIYMLLVKNNFEIYGINPNRKEVEGIRCYSSLAELPEKVQGAIIVTNPAISKEVIQQCLENNVRNLWFQYETMNDEIRQWCTEKEVNWIQSCILLHSNDVGFPHNVHQFFYKIFVRN